LIKKVVGDIINSMEQVRCAKCGRRLYDGSPGWDILTGKTKEQECICPRCGEMNIITCEIKEKVIVRVKDGDSKYKNR